MRPDVMFSKATDLWATPQAVFDALEEEFLFDVDAAASAENAKCRFWFGPGGHRDDGLAPLYWGKNLRVWLNPPYSRCAEFVKRAAMEARDNGNTVVMLIPSRTDTRYWHEHIWDREKHQPRPGVEIRFLKGRLKFGNSQNSAPFPSVVIIFRPPQAASVAA